MFWSSVIAERNTLLSSDPLVFTSADLLVYVGRIFHFFLRRCGRKTTSSPDHCFNVLFPACVIFADPVSRGGLPPLRLPKLLTLRAFSVFTFDSSLDVAEGGMLYGSAVTDERSTSPSDAELFRFRFIFYPLRIDLPSAAPPLRLQFHFGPDE